jgi:hypothetical protein
MCELNLFEMPSMCELNLFEMSQICELILYVQLAHVRKNMCLCCAIMICSKIICQVKAMLKIETCNLQVPVQHTVHNLNYKILKTEI